MLDLAGRLAGRVQLTSDGMKFYHQAVKAAFGNEIDYAQLVKIYGEINFGRTDRRKVAGTTHGKQGSVIEGVGLLRIRFSAVRYSFCGRSS